MASKNNTRTSSKKRGSIAARRKSERKEIEDRRLALVDQASHRARVESHDHDAPVTVEIFPCAGGMAKGFKDAGITFDVAIEYMPNHCDSYHLNLGHRPMCMDARDFLRMIRMGLFKRRVSLLVADPPCTPWSRSGKREGTDDDRDMLEETCEIIRLLRPEVYLIGNVPGLDDGPNLATVQRVIGSLAREGYCTADFARLDAANYGVPQHRVRPFWFGHRIDTRCIQWPEPTHGDPKSLRDQLTLPGVQQLMPWITCGQALGHLRGADLGRPVKLRKRNQNGKQHGSVAERPALGVGCSNLSDGNVVIPHAAYRDPMPEVNVGEAIERGAVTLNGENHIMSRVDAPARTLTRNTHGDGCIIINDRHRPATTDAPAPTVGAKNRSQSAGVLTVRVNETTGEPIMHPHSEDDAPARALTSGGRTHVMERKTSKKHRANGVDEPAQTLRGGGEGHSAPEVLIEQAPEIFSVEPHQDRPATVVQADPRLAPPGHKDENWSGGIMSLPNAVVISEKAAAILQGFPQDWIFVGVTKKERWSQIGQAMPPALAAAVAGSVAQQIHRTQLEANGTVVPLFRGKPGA